MTNPAEMLTAAIQDIGALRQRLDAIVDDQNSMAESLGAVLSDVRQLGGSMESLTAAVASLQNVENTTKDDDEPDPSKLVDWSALSPEQYETELERLRVWVDTELVPTYSVTLDWLPACWQLHRRAVVELSWLCSMWHGIYKSSPPASATYAGDFHLRYLDGVRKNLKDECRRCTSASHQDLDDGVQYALPADVKVPDPVRAGLTLSRRRWWVTSSASLEPTGRR